MADTLFATKGYQSIVRWCDPTINIDAYIIQRTIGANPSDATVAGDIMTGEAETQGLVDVAINTDTSFIGVCMGPVAPPDNYDLDDTIDDGTIINILRPTAGRTIISIVFDGTTTGTYALEEGDWVTISGVAGQAHKWIYADGSISTDSFILVLGQSAQVWANGSTTDRVVAFWY
jgi:hypothetical protein